MGAGLRLKIPKVLGFFWAQRCQLCAAVLDPGLEGSLCSACLSLLPLRTGGYCPCCGDFYADARTRPYICLACRLQPPPWSGLAFYGSYTGTLQELIHRNKFGQDHGLAKLFRYLLNAAWDAHGLQCPQVIVPVPMRPAAILKRGFNQSMELAKLVARDLQVPVAHELLLKIRDTQPQSVLGKKDRQLNVRGAFQACTSMQGQHVLVVDDVLTTGATLKACVQACLQAKAKKVDVLVLARAS